MHILLLLYFSYHKIKKELKTHFSIVSDALFSLRVFDGRANCKANSMKLKSFCRNLSANNYVLRARNSISIHIDFNTPGTRRR